MKSIKKDHLMIVLILLLILFILFIVFYYSYNDISIIQKFNLPFQEQYGNYCGSYNLQVNSESACKSDNECTWNKYIPKKGEPTGWCGLNPEPPHPKYANQKDNVQKLISDFDDANND